MAPVADLDATEDFMKAARDQFSKHVALVPPSSSFKADLPVTDLSSRRPSLSTTTTPAILRHHQLQHTPTLLPSPTSQSASPSPTFVTHCHQKYPSPQTAKATHSLNYSSVTPLEYPPKSSHFAIPLSHAVIITLSSVLRPIPNVPSNHKMPRQKLNPSSLPLPQHAS